MFKRLLTVLIALCLTIPPFFSITPVAFAQNEGYWNNFAADSFSGGSGKAGDPYLISTAEELALLAALSVGDDLIGTHFVLTNNIDLSDHDWMPIRFFGLDYGDEESITLDGRNYTISGLSIREFSYWDRETHDSYRWRSAGLFSVLEYSTVKNLTLESPLVTVVCDDSQEDWDYYAGALAGYAEQSIIENCHVLNPEVSLTCTDAGDSYCYVGGMVGSCYSDVMLMGCSVVGGAATSVSRTEHVYFFAGGLTGYSENNSLICNSSASAALNVRVLTSSAGTVTERAYSFIYVGGLVGESRGVSLISNSYSAAKLNLELQASGRIPLSAYIGGIAGGISGNMQNSYFCGDISLKENLGNDDYLSIGKTFGYCTTTNGMCNNYYVYGASGEPDWWSITTDYDFVNSSYAYLVTTPIEELDGADKKAALCLALNMYLYHMVDSIGFNIYPGNNYWEQELYLQDAPPHTSSWKIVEGVNDGYPVFSSENEWPFDDVTRGDWFFESVRHVYLRGVVKGVSNTQFAPGQTLNRASLVTLLWRLEGEPEPTGASAFSDVETGAWYDKAVSWAAENEIVSGYGDGRFAPIDILTREQTAAIFFRYAQFKDYVIADKSFRFHHSYNDIDNISEWALEAFKWCNYFEIIEGSNDYLLLPKNGSTRAEAATIIMRLTEYLYMWRDDIPKSS